MRTTKEEDDQRWEDMLPLLHAIISLGASALALELQSVVEELATRKRQSEQRRRRRW